MCRESTNGPTVEPTKNSFAEVAFGGSNGGLDDDDIFIAAELGYLDDTIDACCVSTYCFCFCDLIIISSSSFISFFFLLQRMNNYRKSNDEEMTCVVSGVGLWEGLSGGAGGPAMLGVPKFVGAKFCH